MNDRVRFGQLIEEVDFLLAEGRHLRARGVHLIVTHRDHVPGTICAPGEMIGEIALGGFLEPVSLGLAHMSLLLMDYLCRYRMPLSALRIEQIMNTGPFYVHYAANKIRRHQVIARPDRNTVRVYIGRIRKQMENVFREVGLNLDLRQVLVSEMTDSNVPIYKLKVTAEIAHAYEWPSLRNDLMSTYLESLNRMTYNLVSALKVEIDKIILLLKFMKEHFEDSSDKDIAIEMAGNGIKGEEEIFLSVGGGFHGSIAEVPEGFRVTCGRNQDGSLWQIIAPTREAAIEKAEKEMAMDMAGGYRNRRSDGTMGPQH